MCTKAKVTIDYSTDELQFVYIFKNYMTEQNYNTY